MQTQPTAEETRPQYKIMFRDCISQLSTITEDA